MDSERYYNTPPQDNSRPCENEGCVDGYIYTTTIEWGSECLEKTKCPFCEEGFIND